MSIEEYKRTICPQCIYYKKEKGDCDIRITIDNNIKCSNFKRDKRKVKNV